MRHIAALFIAALLGAIAAPAGSAAAAPSHTNAQAVVAHSTVPMPCDTYVTSKLCW
ncbi:hypothetical protein J2Z21_000529 [Streptomyces griseochromogenes]|uniref:Chaplin domain-containing protein n=1 Tax=Streptomyces griseochromogenes TaxID=68214 RepID=A0ABS4LJP0_9ACTN|nr:hypothetical protein [Streptomyces griseochromogenes]MBP2047607.1 hypothetical protein [Streptomyces griseochromogenes]